MGNCCLRPGHLFVGHRAIDALQEEKQSRFFLFPGAARALHEEIKHLQDNTSATMLLTLCSSIASEMGVHQNHPAEALSICQQPKPRAPAQRGSANPTLQSSINALAGLAAVRLMKVKKKQAP